MSNVRFLCNKGEKNQIIFAIFRTREVSLSEKRKISAKPELRNFKSRTKEFFFFMLGVSKFVIYDTMLCFYIRANKRSNNCL